MPSIKMQEWETEFLSHTGKLKELLHKVVTLEKHGEAHSEIKQEFLRHINALFDSGHSKVRRLNKSLAFLHQEVDLLRRVLKENNIEVKVQDTNPQNFKLGDIAHVSNKGTESRRSAD